MGGGAATSMPPQGARRRDAPARHVVREGRNPVVRLRGRRDGRGCLSSKKWGTAHGLRLRSEGVGVGPAGRRGWGGADDVRLRTERDCQGWW
ncbi:hypothetical protein chiPu_0025013 [Chiloscyllium punctatum]|uniref:Uncharacterized protein n=1 Tax=Chiloscyllium punctatum TaxID=137246 RepID=A0A401TFB8_CHIPU|nr:hypothetical protein [Chiloscyllium punctatum]